MRVSVSPARLEVTPGVPQQLEITITNPGTVIGGYTVRMLGVDPSWVELDTDDASLFPDESRILTAKVTVPVGLVAGERRMAVQVRELTPPCASAVEEIVLVVPEARNVRVAVDPVVVTAGRSGRFSLLVDNTGNTHLTGWLAAEDAEDKLRYRVEPTELDLAPGEHAVVDLQVKGRRPFLGQSLVRLVNLHLGEGPLPPDEDEALRVRKRKGGPPPTPDAPTVANATFIQKAVLSRGLLSLVGLLAAVTVFAIVITLALSRIVGQSAADRNLALEIAAAEDGADTGGSSGVSGVVRLLTSGDPAPGVSVNVFAADDPTTPLSTTATDDQGAYGISGLPAGDYKLSYRGAGFVQLWFPQALDPENAEAVTLEDNNRVSGLDVALGGVPASISGTVLGADVSDAVVALRTPSPLSSAPGTGGVSAASAPGDGATVQTVPVGADGAFSLANVPSPSVYDLVVTKEGYASSTQRIDVSAGEDRGNVDISLVEGNGVIAGEVVAAGEPLGGVTLTATSGQSTATTLSLTDGDVGSFRLRQLPTPGTYTLVAGADGYASQTLTVTLGDGQTLSGVSLTLGRASGSLRGKATMVTGAPAGGVTVTVTDGQQTIQTASQSAGDSVGSWEVSGLALPGTYTVTFSRADVESQTVSVSLDSTGTVTPGSLGATVSADGITTALRSSSAVLRGVVSQPDAGGVVGPVGEVAVTISSGTSTYTVTTGSVPAGQTGAYRIEQIPPGTYTISVSRSGVTPTSTIRTLVAGQELVYSPRLARPALVSGVVTRSGSPVGGGYVVEIYRATDYPSTVYRTTRTDANGAYSFDDVDAPETYVVQVRRSRGSAPLGSTNVQVSASQQATNANVRVRDDG